MYRFSDSVEEIFLGEKKFLANFSSGVLIPLDEKKQEILGEEYLQKSFKKEDFSENPEFWEELDEGSYFDVITQPLASAYLHITNICNLNCIGCYSFDRTRNCKDKLTLENITHILDELYCNGVENLIISGGEPTIRKDLVDIVAYAKKIGIDRIQVITNGTRYDEEKLIQLKPYIDALAVSIDGYSDENPQFIRDEGIFPKVIKFVEGARDLGIPVSILPTLHHYNIEHIEDYIELSRKLKVSISFSLLTCSGELESFIPTEENLKYLASYLYRFMKSGAVPLQDYTSLEAKKSCGAGENIISVTAEGDVYPCHMMHDTDKKMGNLLKESLESIMKRSRKIPSVDQIHRCNTCKVKNVCGGGCKARALLMKGTWNHPDPYCEMNLNYYSRFVEEYNKYA